MEFIYNKRKYIASLSFVPLFLTLLLALNFKIWGGINNDGDLEKIIANQTQELDHCLLSNIDNSINVKSATQIKQFLDTELMGAMIDCVIFFTLLVWIDQSKFFCERRDTLISLCIRMDE